MADDTSTTDGADTAAADTADTQAPAPQTTDIPPEVKRALSKANKEAENLRLKLKEYEDRDKTESQKLEERASAAEMAAARATQELLRLRVAAANGLTPEFAARLQGNTEAELAADAEALKTLLGGTTPPSFDAGARNPAPNPSDMNALIRRAAGHH